MGSIIRSGHIHIISKKFFQTTDQAGEPCLNFDFKYFINGQTVEASIAESRLGLAECNPSSIRAFIQEKEPLPLDTMVDPEDAETARVAICNSVASLVHDSAGIQGLKMLKVSVVVEINQEEEDQILVELDGADLLRKKRMSLLQNYVGAAMAETDNEVCAICLEEMRVGEALASTPCVHRFHRPCINRWFETASFCPLCRLKIE